MAAQGIAATSSLHRVERVTRNSTGPRHKILICSDSLEQIQMLSPSQVDFIENEKQVQNELIDAKDSNRSSTRNNIASFPANKYASVDDLKIN